MRRLFDTGSKIYFTVKKWDSTNSIDLINNSGFLDKIKFFVIFWVSFHFDQSVQWTCLLQAYNIKAWSVEREENGKLKIFHKNIKIAQECRKIRHSQAIICFYNILILCITTIFD